MGLEALGRAIGDTSTTPETSEPRNRRRVAHVVESVSESGLEVTRRAAVGFALVLVLRYAFLRGRQ